MFKIIYFISFSILILYIIDIEDNINKNKYIIDNWNQIKLIILIIALLEEYRIFRINIIKKYHRKINLMYNCLKDNMSQGD